LEILCSFEKWATDALPDAKPTLEHTKLTLNPVKQQQKREKIVRIN